MVNSFDSSLVSKYDGINDDFTCLPCLLSRGFKKPRELTWVTGVTLATVTVSFGVTGYSLPWDQVGYWACKIVTGVSEAIPVVGSLLVEVLRGGQSVGQNTLTRFHGAHTFVLPLVAAVLMLAHFNDS